MKETSLLVDFQKAISNFLFDPEIASAASIAGVAISIIGFGFTLIMVWRSQSAASAASQAAKEARAAFHQFEIIADFSAAIPLMEEIKRLHREQAWHSLPDRYASLRKTLIGLRHKHSDLSEEHNKVIQSAITHLSELELKVDEIIEKGTNLKGVPKVNSVVSRQVDNLHQILLEIRDRLEK